MKNNKKIIVKNGRKYISERLTLPKYTLCVAMYAEDPKSKNPQRTSVAVADIRIDKIVECENFWAGSTVEEAGDATIRLAKKWHSPVEIVEEICLLEKCIDHKNCDNKCEGWLTRITDCENAISKIKKAQLLN